MNTMAEVKQYTMKRMAQKPIEHLSGLLARNTDGVHISWTFGVNEASVLIDASGQDFIRTASTDPDLSTDGMTDLKAWVVQHLCDHGTEFQIIRNWTIMPGDPMNMLVLHNGEVVGTITHFDLNRKDGPSGLNFTQTDEFWYDCAAAGWIDDRQGPGPGGWFAARVKDALAEVGILLPHG